MRTYRLVWLWLASMVFGHPWLLTWSDHVGATLGWSPIAAVSSVEQTASWDVRGWYREGQDELHDALDAIEMRLWLGLVEVRETAYQWRDSETKAVHVPPVRRGAQRTQRARTGTLVVKAG